MNFIVSAPSGSGKTTILKKVFDKYPTDFGFSVSATTRMPRDGEKDGVDYYFLTIKEFNERIQNDDFLEYEQVYEGLFYGTLKSEIVRINALSKKVVFDVDVKGGVNIKNILGDEVLSIFIMPPNREVLEKRLIRRNTETRESLQRRLRRAEMEISYSKYFDKIIINDDLDKAVEDFISVVKQYIL
ncbi:MAG: guanylate kinase [Bacteroidales bacterium]